MKRTAAWLLRLAFIAFALLALPAYAHKASDAYLQLQRIEGGVALRWDIALRDLDAVLELDRDGDQKLSWGEVKERLPDIRAYALAHLQLQRGRCALAEASAPALERRVDGTYLVLQLQGQCAVGEALDVDYSLFREVDPTHRGLLRVDLGAPAAPLLRSLDPVAGVVTMGLAAKPGGVSTPAPAEHSMAAGAAFFLDGVHHILIGYDHILFLISLLLPAVLIRTASGWTPVARWKDAVWPMVAIVTMFTLGHSITLALAGLGIVSLSPKVIEPAIALTIIVAAVDNIVPLLRGHRRLFTFLFGLIHGFGFASVLSELDLPMGSFVAALLQFNLGVEAGQLVIVSVALSILLALRRWRGYRAVLLRGGSAFAIVIAALWFAERVFDLKILPV
ncbi:MAG: HupE/UreJ family protein [Comamonadaceae bacterium]|nr:MAG: HupE/UreJ family protein [Comamonadaceae bacterium]